MAKKYAILSKGTTNYNSGNGALTTGTPADQTEAATELIINRLAFIDKLQRGKLDRKTIVVTLPERKFLYENLVDTVVDFEEKYWGDRGYDTQHKDIDALDFISPVNFDKHIADLPYYTNSKGPLYGNYERDKELIQNIKYDSNILDKKLDDFLICIPRLKRSDTRRNLDKEYWTRFLSIAKKYFSRVFVFGKETKYLISDNIEYVDTLKEYCSYVHHPSCKHVISTISGPCHYVQSFGNVSGKTVLSMIDNNSMLSDVPEERDASYFHPCLNFSNVKLNIIKGDKKHNPPEPEKLAKELWEQE